MAADGMKPCAALIHARTLSQIGNPDMITSKIDREKMRFFLTYAGTSYQPGKETKRRGRWNGAALLTDAEIRMLDSGALICGTRLPTMPPSTHTVNYCRPILWQNPLSS